MSSGWVQPLSSSAQEQDKEQKSQTGTQEVPSDYEERFLHCVGDRALKQFATREVVVSPSLEIFKAHQDAFLCREPAGR